MTELRDRLADLAHVVDSFPDSGTAQVARDRSRAYLRRKRAGTAFLLTACIAMALAVSVTAWLRAPDPRPADSDTTPALPDQVHQPSPWLPGTADAGPPGIMAAVLEAERGSWNGSRPGLVAISGTTGEYRFLDLEGGVLTEEWALSPDGQRLAYWTTGDTEASPNLGSGGPVTGVAVYNGTTGDTIEHRVVTDHGLSPGELVWAGSDRLILGYGQYLGGRGDSDMARSTSTLGPSLVWDLADAPRRLEVPDGSDIAAAGPGYALFGGPARYTLLRLDTGERTLVRLGSDTSSVPTLDDTGTRVAVVAGMTGKPGSTSNPNVIRVGPVGGEVSRLRGSDRTFRVIDWVDAHHVAVHQRLGRIDAARLRTAINVVDTRNGTTRRVSALPELAAPQLATDLLEFPTRRAVEPPRPLDPRVTTGGIALALLLGVGSTVWWRRRATP